MPLTLGRAAIAPKLIISAEFVATIASDSDSAVDPGATVRLDLREIADVNRIDSPIRQLTGSDEWPDILFNLTWWFVSLVSRGRSPLQRWARLNPSSLQRAKLSVALAANTASVANF
ncbi:MAG: hypothetical protein HC838_16775 [Spirulinaceae cyanobacterium RM2_2_10]|nr:hypothetical protein [Spirulinaceae cyanobacterium RM2_2_10]